MCHPIISFTLCCDNQYFIRAISKSSRLTSRRGCASVSPLPNDRTATVCIAERQRETHMETDRRTHRQQRENKFQVFEESAGTTLLLKSLWDTFAFATIAQRHHQALDAGTTCTSRCKKANTERSVHGSVTSLERKDGFADYSLLWLFMCEGYKVHNDSRTD